MNASTPLQKELFPQLMNQKSKVNIIITKHDDKNVCSS